MTRRRTKKQKIASQKRNQNKELISKLEAEKQEILKKQDNLLTKYKDEKGVKNRKIFKSTYKLIYPYLLLTIGVQIPILFIHGGFPFVIDSHKCYKKKSLEINYEGEMEYQEGYVTNYWYDNNTFPNTLRVTTPWIEYIDGGKCRTIREYKITYSDELADAILSSDYEAIGPMLDDCTREILETSNDPFLNDHEYHLEGKLGTLDMEYSIKVPETKSDNDITTGFEVGLYVFVSLLILRYRKFRYMKTLKTIKQEKKEKKEDYEIAKANLNRQIEAIDQKILTIKKKGA